MPIARGDSRWSRVLIVEGTSGVGKSTLIDALVRRHVADRPVRKLRTLLHLTQAHTYGPLVPDEDSGALTVAQNVAHLDRIASLLEWHVGALTAESAPRFYAVVDTLHLTHCHHPGVVSWNDVAAIDQRLAQIGARMLFVQAAAQTIWERGIEPRRAEEFIADYAAPRWGPSLEAVHRHFVDEQSAMLPDLARTRLEHLALPVDRPLSSYVDEAYAFWTR